MSVSAGTRPCQALGGAGDLGLARQEHQDRARIGAQRGQRRGGHLVLEALQRIGRDIAGLDREGPALAGDDWSVAEQRGDAGAVDGGGHDQQPEIGAERGGIERQREAQIGIEAALVKFVEEHGGDATQFRIVQQHAGEDALGDDLDAGFGGDFGVEPDAIANGLAGVLTERAGHEACRGAGGEAARFEHDDVAVPTPCRIEQR